MSGRTGLISALMLVLALAGCKTELYSGLSEREANDMLSVLLANDIQASKEAVGDKGLTVQVDDDDVLYALDVLAKHGFPRETRESIGQVFQKTGIMSSPFEERVRFVYALGEEVARTLTEIDGVLTARVHIVMPDEPEMGQKAQPSSAAVFIKHVADKNLDVFAPQIRRLVANSIEGVEYDDVTVLLMVSEQTQPAVMMMRPPMENIFGLNVDRSQAKMAWTLVQGVGAGIGVLVLLNIFTFVALLRRRKGDKPSSGEVEVAGE